MQLKRQNSRKLLDQLTPGERFMLMFGRGVVKHDPLRVVWKDESNAPVVAPATLEPESTKDVMAGCPPTSC